MVRTNARGLLVLLLQIGFIAPGHAQGISVSEKDIEIYSCDESDGTLLLMHLNGSRVLAIAESDLGYGKETEPGVYFFYLTGGFARLSASELLLVESASEARLPCTRIDEIWREAIQMLVETPYVDNVQLESVSSPKVNSLDDELRLSKARQEALSLQLELVRESLEEVKKQNALHAAQVQILRKKLNKALASAAAKEKRIRELEDE